MRKPMTSEQREAKRQRERAWYAANPERAKAKNAAFREKSADYFKEYYAANRDRRIAQASEQYTRDPEGAKRRARESYRRRAALGLPVRSDDKEAARVRTQNRRGLMQAVGEPINKSFLRALLVTQKFRCAACTCDIKKSYHADHITALARGGEHSRANMQLLCKTCNLQKHAKDPVEWRQSLGFLL